MIVDAWMIPATAEVIDRWMTDPRYVHGFKAIFGTGAPEVRSPQAMVEEMDRAGIDVAVLTTMGDWSGPVAPASLVAEICERFPDRFVASYCYDPARINPSLDELEEFAGSSTVVSALVLPWAFDRPPDDARWFPLYARAERSGIAVTIQVGHTAPLFRSVLGRPMAVEEVALAFPDLRIVLGHLGWPWVEEVIALATKYPNVYIDTSAHSPSRLPTSLVDFMRSRGGQHKVLFGTDYPALDLARAVASAKRLPLPTEALTDYLGANAARVFRLEGHR